MERIPVLTDVGIRKFFCGPESFTPDVHPMLGPAPELDNFWVAAGLNSLGILLGGGVGSVVAQWMVDGVPPVDVAHYSVERALPHEVSRRFRSERTVEQLGVLFGDGACPSWQPATARGIRRSPLHDRLAAAWCPLRRLGRLGVPGVVRGPGATPADPTMSFDRQASFELVAAEHRADPRGRRRHGHDADVRSSSSRALGRSRYSGGCRPATSTGRSGASSTRSGSTRAVASRPTSPSPGSPRSGSSSSRPDVIHRRVAAMIRRETFAGEQVYVTDVTSGTVLLSVQGPRSRELLARLTTADLSNDAFPYLTAQTIELDYARVLALRVTYVGELGWELHVPTEYAPALYDTLMATGADLGIVPVGLAAMGGLRLEKGYRDFGVDIDNTDDPLTAGLGFAVAWDKPGGFVGREALLDRRSAGPRTSAMVSLLLDDPEVELFGNEPLLVDGRPHARPAIQNRANDALKIDSAGRREGGRVVR